MPPTFIMKFCDKVMYPYNYVVIGIVQDSLVLKDFAIDAMTYHFSKSKKFFNNLKPTIMKQFILTKLLCVSTLCMCVTL